MSRSKNYENKYCIVVQDIFRPFNPEVFQDLAKYCKVSGANYEYLSHEDLPIVYKGRWVINRIEVSK